MYASTTEQQRNTAVQSLADQIYRERHHYLLRIATRNAANKTDAEEALQDAFVYFIDHFQPAGEAPALAWLILTLKRRCWALHRRRRLERRTGQEATAGDNGTRFHVASIPSRASGPEQLLTRVDEARAGLATLKPVERRALGLIAAGYSYIEVGEITGWTYTKNYQTKFRSAKEARNGVSHETVDDPKDLPTADVSDLVRRYIN